MNGSQMNTSAAAQVVPVSAIHWYAISTKPHQECVAEANIRRLGVETFSPLLKQQKVIRKKKQTCISPLFPGYLFARFELEHQYRFIHYSRGIKRIVSFGEEPAIVDDSLIDGIRGRLRDGLVLEPDVEFSNGQVVRIKEGPLHGLEAIFEREVTGAQRAVLLLKALSYQARVVVCLQDIVNL